MVLNFPKALSFCSDIIKIQVQFAKQDQDIFSECTQKNSRFPGSGQIIATKKRPGPPNGSLVRDIPGYFMET